MCKQIILLVCFCLFTWSQSIHCYDKTDIIDRANNKMCILEYVINAGSQCT